MKIKRIKQNGKVKLSKADEIQQENEQILSQTIAQLTLENADLKVQLQTLAQTIAQMQLK